MNEKALPSFKTSCRKAVAALNFEFSFSFLFKNKVNTLVV